MEPKQVAQRNKQRERQQRGADFQEEIRRSWRLLPNVWRLRLKDGGGGTNPGDELVLTEDINILAEHKRTEGRKFELGFLRTDQLNGLIDFDRVISRNYGLVFVSFHNPKDGLDEAYAFRLITAVKFLQKRGVLYIPIESFRTKAIPCIDLPRIQAAQPYYDLMGVVTCYKSL